MAGEGQDRPEARSYPTLYGSCRWWGLGNDEGGLERASRAIGEGTG